MARRGEKLEEWLTDAQAALMRRDVATELAYDDRVGGDVLVLALAPRDPDAVVWLTSTRRARGQIHLTVMAHTRAAGVAAVTATAGLHLEVARLANLRRKFVHRVERMLAELVETWDARAALPAGLAEAVEKLRYLAPGARPAIGLGFHAEVAGAAEHHTRVAYPSVYGAGFDSERGWQVLPWDPHARTWATSTAAVATLARHNPGVDLALGGVAVGATMAAAMTAFAVGAPTVAMAGVGAGAGADAKRSWFSSADCGACHVTPCDLASLVDLVPDCSFDCGDLGIGDCSPDCSL